MKQIAIVYRSHTEAPILAAKKLAVWLKKQNIKVWTAPEQKVLAGTTLIKSKTQWKKIDLVLVLGGDGTYLRAVRLLEGIQIPILGFNMGSLGFLTIFSEKTAQETISATLKGEMQLEPRSMITAKIIRKGKIRGQYQALNDIVIERGSFSQLIDCSIYLERMLISSVKADGFIVSTPTGSTAYNLAAGGPLVAAHTKALVVTPVAPHSLTSRPLILPDHQNIRFQLEGKTHKAHFVVDGQRRLELTSADEVQVKKCEFDHLVVRPKGFNEFSLLRDKLKFGDRS